MCKLLLTDILIYGTIVYGNKNLKFDQITCLCLQQTKYGRTMYAHAAKNLLTSSANCSMW